MSSLAAASSVSSPCGHARNSALPAPPSRHRRGHRPQKTEFCPLLQADSEVPLRLRGIESPCLVDCPVHRPKRAADRAGEAQGQRRRDDRVALAHEERIAEKQTQPLKCVADRRLGEIEFGRRACKASARLDHLQNGEQVEVDSGHERRSYPWLNKRHLFPGAHRATLPP